ncbi:MAG TPA: hypothetical protein VIU12_02435 [Chryseolinea sp.]
MKEERNFDGLMLGIVFTFGSLLLTLTFFVPIISVLPGVIVETVAKGLVDNDPYSNVGKATTILLAIFFVIALSISLFKIRRTTMRDGKISKTKIAIVMTFMFFIVHSLGFYIYWGVALHYRGDGQLIFAAVDSFPKSSWTFIPIGLIIDVTRNFRRPTA